MTVATVPLEQVPVDGCIAVADGRVLLTRASGQVAAWQNRCLHRDTPLDAGVVVDGVVVCPLHFWRYDLATGRNTASGAPLPSVPVQVVDGIVHVEPPTEPQRSLRDTLLAHAATWDRDGTAADTTSKETT